MGIRISVLVLAITACIAIVQTHEMEEMWEDSNYDGFCCNDLLFDLSSL